MSDKLSEKFRSFVFDESPENGNEDVIKELNSRATQGDIHHRLILDNGLGRDYFYECMRLAYNVIRSFEIEELENER